MVGNYVKKVKCAVVQALRLCTDLTAHMGCRGIALLFLDHGTRRGWGVSVTPRPLFTPGKDPVPVVQEAVWTPGPVWKSAENHTPTEIWSPDRPALNQSLYRLSYPAHSSCLAEAIFDQTFPYDYPKNLVPVILLIHTTYGNVKMRSERRHMYFTRREITQTEEYNMTHVFDNIYMLPPTLAQPQGELSKRVLRDCAGQQNSRKGHYVFLWGSPSY